QLGKIVEDPSSSLDDGTNDYKVPTAGAGATATAGKRMVRLLHRPWAKTDPKGGFNGSGTTGELKVLKVE
ncbi:unnamed protein product, partial [Amoebophrya sp. A25]